MQDVDAVPRAMDVLRDPSEDHGGLGGGAAVDGNEEHARVPRASPPVLGPRRGDGRRGGRRGVSRLARALAAAAAAVAVALARGHGDRARGKMRVGNPRRARCQESRQ